MNKIYMRGDTHGNFDFLPQFCEENHTDKSDILIILGDAGFNFYGERHYKEKALKEFAANCPITLFCIRGNHENRPTNYTTMVTYQHNIITGDEVYMQPDYANIFYAKDGGEYTIYNKTFLTIGGAYSVDKWHRLRMGWTWFIDEQLTPEEMQQIERKIAGKSYDYILTHTCPYLWRPTDLFLSCVDQNSVDTTTEKWLEDIKDTFNFKYWYFGHYHADRDDVCGDNKVTMLFHQIIQL